MSIPLFYPPVEYASRLRFEAPVALRQLCELAGASCKASGPWIEREVEVVHGSSFRILAEPGSWGRVRVEVPISGSQAQARLALAAMAYGMHDLVAKQSIAGKDWAGIGNPKGRPRSGRPMSNSERQKKFRERRAATRDGGQPCKRKVSVDV